MSIEAGDTLHERIRPIDCVRLTRVNRERRTSQGSLRCGTCADARFDHLDGALAGPAD